MSNFLFLEYEQNKITEHYGVDHRYKVGVNDRRKNADKSPQKYRRESVLVFALVVKRQYHGGNNQPYSSEGVVVGDSRNSREENRVEQRTDRSEDDIIFYAAEKYSAKSSVKGKADDTPQSEILEGFGENRRKQFEKYCKLFVTDEEYDIMMGMKLRGNTEAELRALYTGSDWAGTLYDMCRKGFLLKIYDGPEPTFDLAPMLPGWFEFPLSTGEDNETLQKASELFTSAINMVTTLNVEPLRTGYAVMNNLNKLKGDKGHMEVALPLEGKAAGKVVHVDRKLSNDTTSVVPSYQLEAYLDSLPDDSPISVMHCFCRNIRRREGMQPKHPTPDEVCLCVGNIAKQIIEYGVGRQVSKGEARQILVDCEKKGCVHQVFHYACNMDEETTAICNCDTQCCEMLGSYTRGGMQPLYMRAHAKPVIVHPENCNGCNICNHFCPTVATGFNAQTGKVFVEYQRCIGCGVCVTKCPKDVRKMVDGDRVLFCKPLKKSLVRERNVRRQPKKN